MSFFAARLSSRIQQTTRRLSFRRIGQWNRCGVSAFATALKENFQDHCAKDFQQSNGENVPQRAGTIDAGRFIPQATGLHAFNATRRRRVLILCTGGTLTMQMNSVCGGLAPVEGAFERWVTADIEEFDHPGMPEIVVHEYKPLMDSSDMGPLDWQRLALDISDNYLHFDGFVVVMGTDTMAYAASALSFMLENLAKPVIFTGSQIPFCEPYNDARRNVIMASIFASRDTICEVALFFHDRLLRGCRATKVNTHKLNAFDSPNLAPLAQIGITIEENSHMRLPQCAGALRVHGNMETRLLVVRLVPGFDASVLLHAIQAQSGLRALVLELYGTGNIPSSKKSFLDALSAAANRGILVVAVTQCPTGSVLLGKYAVGRELKEIGVVSAGDMTLEATSAKLAYLFGRGDLTVEDIGKVLAVPLRGEITPREAYDRETLKPHVPVDEILYNLENSQITRLQTYHAAGAPSAML